MSSITVVGSARTCSIKVGEIGAGGAGGTKLVSAAIAKVAHAGGAGGTTSSGAPNMLARRYVSCVTPRRSTASAAHAVPRTATGERANLQAHGSAGPRVTELQSARAHSRTGKGWSGSHAVHIGITVCVHTNQQKPTIPGP